MGVCVIFPAPKRNGTRMTRMERMVADLAVNKSAIIR